MQVTHVGAVSIADLVKTTLGPKGMVHILKLNLLIVGRIGESTLMTQFNLMMHASRCRTKFYSQLEGGALLQ